MNNDKSHTPGPWTYCGKNSAGRGGMVSRFAPGTDPHEDKFIAIVYGENVNASSEANGHLIAAAPDLLNALVTLADVAESRGIPVDAARAAIARAEGRS